MKMTLLYYEMATAGEVCIIVGKLLLVIVSVVCGVVAGFSFYAYVRMYGMSDESYRESVSMAALRRTIFSENALGPWIIIPGIIFGTVAFVILFGIW